MIESIFIWMASVAFVTFILGVERENIIYSMLSTILWVMTMVGALYVQVPNDTNYMDLGFSGICLAFIFTNIIWLLMMNAATKQRKRFHL